jgi:uncharacterized RDD family membrane protein YckC
MMLRLVLAAAAMSAAWAFSASAEEAFVGRWAATTEVCASHGGDSPANSALVATATSLWWFDGVCRIGKMYKTTAVYVQAHCDGKDVAVTLDAAGDRLRVIWAGKAQELKRCK